MKRPSLFLVSLTCRCCSWEREADSGRSWRLWSWAGLRSCREGTQSGSGSGESLSSWTEKRFKYYIIAFSVKADLHSLRRSAFSAVDCVNAEIEKFISLCGNATVHCVNEPLHNKLSLSIAYFSSITFGPLFPSSLNGKCSDKDCPWLDLNHRSLCLKRPPCQLCRSLIPTTHTVEN